jgi:hypothetical protein
VGKIRRVRQRHGDVERSHGNGSDQVSLEILPFVLLSPIQNGDVVLQIHEALIFDTMAVGQPFRGALLPVAAVHTSFDGRIAQQRVGGGGSAFTRGFRMTRKCSPKAVHRVHAPRKAAVVPVRFGSRRDCAMIAVGVTAAGRDVPVLVVAQTRAHSRLEVDFDNAALRSRSSLVGGMGRGIVGRGEDAICGEFEVVGGAAARRLRLVVVVAVGMHELFRRA